jgi:hypothetical protein
MELYEGLVKLFKFKKLLTSRTCLNYLLKQKHGMLNVRGVGMLLAR